jgi:hypothetical protein
MFRTAAYLRHIALLAILAGCCLTLQGDRGAAPAGKTAWFAPDMPRTILWAWEEPEDLRTADPKSVGVAFLAERVFLGSEVNVVRRHQPILVPQGIWAEAVVRLETQAGFADDETSRQAAADAILWAARLPNLRGVQVDFDATVSQREFYADVLRRVRAALPRTEGLEMTALLSWCSQSESRQNGNWIRSLPVDAAIPMDFRLGKHVGNWTIRQPLCLGSIGISTDELYVGGRAVRAQANAARHDFVFAPRPWTPEQLAIANRGGIPDGPGGPR